MKKQVKKYLKFTIGENAENVINIYEDMIFAEDLGPCDEDACYKHAVFVSPSGFGYRFTNATCVDVDDEDGVTYWEAESVSFIHY